MLKDIKDRGHRLGSVYEQELKKKISSAIEFNSKINDLNEKLQVKNKSLIKTLNREATLAQKASSVDKAMILSLEAKVGELEAKLKNNEPESSSISSEQIIPATIFKEKISLGGLENSINIDKLLSSVLACSILLFLLIVIIWLVVVKKLWNLESIMPPPSRN